MTIKKKLEQSELNEDISSIDNSSSQIKLELKNDDNINSLNLIPDPKSITKKRKTKDIDLITNDYNITNEEMQKRVEALFFASNNYLDIDTISSLTELSVKNARKGLELFENELINRKSPILLLKSENTFKLSVHKDYSFIVHKVVSNTELTKSLIETLAVIAWKNPILQSEIIRIRNNKAYDHLYELEEKGFIVRQPFKRSMQVKLTSKFYEYFDIPKKLENLSNLVPDEVKSQIMSAETDLLSKLAIMDQMLEQKEDDKKMAKEKSEAIKENLSLDSFDKNKEDKTLSDN